MQTELLSNLEDRLARYRSECAAFYAVQLPAMFLFFVVVQLAIFYALDRYLGPLTQDWRILAVGFALMITVPPVLVMRPRKPTFDDVLRDQRLRRSFGLDDTVRK